MNTHLLFDVFQILVITVLVAGCTLYCLLTLAPNIIKSPLKRALLRCPLPDFVCVRLQKTNAAGACGSHCSACASKAATQKPVQWHTRKS